MAFIMCNQSLVFSYSASQATVGIADKANASAILGLINMGTAAITVCIMSLIKISNALVLPGIYLAIMLIIVILYKKTLGQLQKE